MPYLQLRTFKMYYEVYGKGFPLILVHGLGGDCRNWEFQVDEFAKRYRVFIPDLRGHGRSEAPKSGYSLNSFMEDIVQLLKEHSITKCHYVGLSMGGMIGQLLAIKHGELLESLTLVDTSPTPGLLNRSGYEDALKMFEQSAKIAEKQGRKPLADVTIKMMFSADFIESKPEIVEKVKKLIIEGPTAGYVNAIRNIILTDLDLYPHLYKIEAPTLIIVGSKDVLTPVEMSKRIHEAIKGSEMVVIENSGHVSNIEKYEEFNKILKNFLKKIDAKRYNAPAVARRYL